ncbi:MAG: hypothetical protein N4Q32_04535 [Neisseriaceae bacterium]|nr:hypothetical protein [Neisseriaceae bacterium]MCV2509685.1 hypothetical protein [Neisseriaceae bacterium]
MRKIIVSFVAVLCLAACANTGSSSGNSEMYGQIQGGVEHTVVK